jgi:predicted GNAT superfamily acetyltransferase
MSDGLEVVPLHLLKSVQTHGGLLLGALAGDELVGFVFGFPGLTGEGKLKHCSHMLGVAPELQGEGTGYQLKLAQRESVLAQGLDLVTWTYDPLESRNARLNIHKLGVVSCTYIRDYYGEMKDGLNAGPPTDRLQVEWWLGSERVRQRLAGETGSPWPGCALKVNITRYTSSGLLAPGSPILDADAPAIQVDIPPDYQAVKAADPGLALEWRLAIRQILEHYFDAGYIATDFLSRQTDAGRESCYTLRPGPSLMEEEPWP